jgi:hypothetical protein
MPARIGQLRADGCEFFDRNLCQQADDHRARKPEEETVGEFQDIRFHRARNTWTDASSVTATPASDVRGLFQISLITINRLAITKIAGAIG